MLHSASHINLDSLFKYFETKHETYDMLMLYLLKWILIAITGSVARGQLKLAVEKIWRNFSGHKSFMSWKMLWGVFNSGSRMLKNLTPVYFRTNLHTCILKIIERFSLWTWIKATGFEGEGGVSSVLDFFFKVAPLNHLKWYVNVTELPVF